MAVHKTLGLTQDELKYVDGFALHGLLALAELRDCWKLACEIQEPGDLVSRGIERAIFELMATAPMQLGREKCLKVLRHGLAKDEANTLLTGLYPRTAQFKEARAHVLAKHGETLKKLGPA